MRRLDDILGYNLKIYQDSHYFSFSLDSIILANYSTIRKRDNNIVDFCTGNGIVPIILSKRTTKKIIGVEIQNQLVECAKESIKYNNLENQIEIINGDIKDFSKNNLNKYDLVLCNPPFFKVDDNTIFSESKEKKIARHEVLIKLEEVCICAKQVLKDNGNFYLVYKCERLLEVIDNLKKHNLEPKRLKFIYDNKNKSATMVLIESQKCGKPGLIIDSPLILYNDDKTITNEYKLLQEEIRK